jgi:hypothetical protein
MALLHRRQRQDNPHYRPYHTAPPTNSRIVMPTSRYLAQRLIPVPCHQPPHKRTYYGNTLPKRFIKRNRRPFPTPRTSPHSSNRRTKKVDKDLEDEHDLLSSMSHLQVNDAIIYKILSKYTLDTTFFKTSLPSGVRFDTSDNLY